jgi:hypothetical protein
MNIDAMIKEYGATVVRNLLLPLISLLAASGYITDEQAAQFALAAAPILVAVVWGLVNKYLWKQTTVEALNTMPPATEKKLENVISNT